jgi:2-polyprenyl-3-methyl-5-hydroxy-6-metoxy-1,4-benzoquinol methylase
MPESIIRYNFKQIHICNMCNSDVTQHKILGERLNKSQGKNPRKKIGITTKICRCKNCGLIFSNPQPIPFDIGDHYGVPPEDYWEEGYFNIKPEYYAEDVQQLKELVGYTPGMRSLDIGAGVGTMMACFANEGFDSYGFEPSEPFYQRAVKNMGISTDKIKLGMIENTEYPDNYFDVVYFGAVLEHLYDPSEAIKKALRWLKPNGVIHIQVPSSDWLIGKIINSYYKLRRMNYVGNLSPMHDPYHLFEFSLKSFQIHAKENGYEIALNQYYVCSTFMPKIFDGVLKKYMELTNTGMELRVWLRKK